MYALPRINRIDDFFTKAIAKSLPEHIMKAMILAAGRGERMRPYTDTLPKPLLKVADKALIEHTIEKLQHAGFTDIVINLAYLGHLIKDFCHTGQRWGVNITYSDEGETALETAGGIAYALPLLGEQPFLVINADIICDFPLAKLRTPPRDLAHLIMISNPEHHIEGDFGLSSDGLLTLSGNDKFTFSGIGVYHPKLFTNIPNGSVKLRPILNKAIAEHHITGEQYSGLWMDIGTPQRLQEVDQLLRKNQR